MIAEKHDKRATKQKGRFEGECLANRALQAAFRYIKGTQEIRQAYNTDKLQALRAELDDRREAAADIAEIKNAHANSNKIRKAGEAKQKKRKKPVAAGQEAPPPNL